jgi:hypothetical protein
VDSFCEAKLTHCTQHCFYCHLSAIQSHVWLLPPLLGQVEQELLGKVALGSNRPGYEFWFYIHSLNTEEPLHGLLCIESL